MTDLFAALYEWFGLLPYSRDMGDHLRGWDILCESYTGTPWYVYMGWLMFAVTGLLYAIQYHIWDRSSFNKKHHWWLVALAVAGVNFLIAFTIPFNAIQSGDHCPDLYLTVPDCLGFGFSNALWGFILFVVITTLPFPRRLSTNCRQTTFWKP
ncbi:MAG: hypothetical protein IT228_11905 [Flavobacteriales bacterium]|nr:hypothetical protein [Flavobacteriales bacterium]MCC6578038.1 hypothetical protein [Flavobacteriales bacterium]NUQ14614.1 hypothetical protein [Flavobacteriales bacterium]